MNLDFLTLLLPILWATVATIVGLLLYKSSEAFFENSGQNDKKKIRLVGSVTIAALAFLGMKISTPSERLYQIPKDSYVINRDKFNNLLELSTNIDRKTLEIIGCYSAIDSSHCLQQLHELKTLATKLKDKTLEVPENK